MTGGASMTCRECEKPLTETDFGYECQTPGCGAGYIGPARDKDEVLVQPGLPIEPGGPVEPRREGELAFQQAPGDVRIAAGPPEGSFHVETQSTFFRRLWFLLTNPFVYLATGTWRL